MAVEGPPKEMSGRVFYRSQVWGARVVLGAADDKLCHGRHGGRDTRYPWRAVVRSEGVVRAVQSVVSVFGGPHVPGASVALEPFRAGRPAAELTEEGRARTNAVIATVEVSTNATSSIRCE